MLVAWLRQAVELPVALAAAAAAVRFWASVVRSATAWALQATSALAVAVTAIVVLPLPPLPVALMALCMAMTEGRGSSAGQEGDTGTAARLMAGVASPLTFWTWGTCGTKRRVHGPACPTVRQTSRPLPLLLPALLLQLPLLLLLLSMQLLMLLLMQLL